MEISKVYKKLEIINCICIIICVLNYIISFSAFDKSSVLSNYDDYEFYTSALVLAMCVWGVVFLLSTISYIVMHRISMKASIESNIVLSVNKILFSLVSIWAGNVLYENTRFHHENFFVEIISGIHALGYLFLAIIMLVASITHLIISIRCRAMYQSQGRYCEYNRYTFMMSTASIMPILVATVLNICVICGVALFYNVLVVIMALPYMLAFSIPASVFLCVVVRRWEEEKRTILVLATYVIYMYVVYGVMDSLFYRAINWLSPSIYSLEHIVCKNFLGVINVAIGLVAGLVCLIRSIKHKR